MFQLIESVDVKNSLGEGVTWDALTQTVWWTDIEEKELFSYKPEVGEVSRYATPDRLCAFGIHEEPQTLIAAFDCGIGLYNIITKDVDWLFRFPEGATVRFNDGRVDANGRFWVGTVNEGGDRTASSGLYRVDTNLAVTKMESNVGICNGLAWNNSQDSFYMSDSARRTIYLYHFESETGHISNKRLFRQFEATAAPDGAVVDNDNNLWSALWGQSCVSRLGSSGGESRFDVPVSQPTCVAFGGEMGNLLFVTSARYGLSDRELRQQPEAGNLFIYQTDVTGSNSYRFSGRTLNGQRR